MPQLPKLMESIRLMTEFANSKVAWLDAAGRGDYDEIGALRGLFFKMTTSDQF
jgi:hypothetical protein